MAKYAVVKNEKVINTVLSDHDFAESMGWILCGPEVGIGWDYLNGVFIDNRPKIEIVENTIREPTKQELLAQLLALQEKINSLP